MSNEIICLINSATTHTILTSKKYFSKLTILETKVNTISSSGNLIEEFGKANIILPRETKFTIYNALFSSQSKRNLLSFKDVRCKCYHIETDRKNEIEYLYIISIVSQMKNVYQKSCMIYLLDYIILIQE